MVCGAIKTAAVCMLVTVSIISTYSLYSPPTHALQLCHARQVPQADDRAGPDREHAAAEQLRGLPGDRAVAPRGAGGVSALHAAPEHGVAAGADPARRLLAAAAGAVTAAAERGDAHVGRGGGGQ